MELSKEQFKQIQEAILSASTENELSRILRTQLNQDLASIASGGNFTDVVFNLVRWAERTGNVVELSLALLDEYPKNATVVKLNEFVRQVDSRPVTSANNRAVERVSSLRKLQRQLSLQELQRALLPSKFLSPYLALTLTTIVIVIIVSFAWFSVPRMSHIGGKGMVLSSLNISNGYLYLGVARDEPRNYGLYSTQIENCQSGLSLTQQILNHPIYDIALDGNDGIAVSEGGVIFKTSNGGATWEPMQINVDFRSYTVVQVDDSLYIGAEQYYVHTAQKDDLRVWTPVGVSSPSLDDDLAAVSATPEDINVLKFDGRDLWIGTHSDGIWKLDISEHRLTTHSSGLGGSTRTIWDIVFDESGNIYLATSSGVLTGNGLSSWDQLGLEGKQVLSLAIARNMLYAGTKENGLYRTSINEPRDWQVIDIENAISYRDLKYDPIYCKGLLAATNQGVWLIPN